MRSRPTTSVGAVTTYLIATDSDDLFGLLDAAIGGTASLVRVSSGQAVRPAVRELEPDLVVLDLQIGTMGAMAVCKDLRLEEGAGRLPRQNVLMLLDRPADVFLADRSSADGWVTKPIDPLQVRRAARAVAAGDGYRHQPSPA